MQLKNYQQKALDAINDFLDIYVKTSSLNDAYNKLAKNIFDSEVTYNNIEELKDVPYLCLRIPTGGGKTIVGAKSLKGISRKLLQCDNPMVLWLTPSDTIRDQTLKAFQNQSHPYFQSLKNDFGEVFCYDTSKTSEINKYKLEAGINIIVSTVQSFRIDDIEMRKVYEANEQFYEHFLDIKPLESLDKDEDGKPIPSLANLIKLHRPIVIVDEAHNVRTELSFETLSRFHPSCILEMTATPEPTSNIIYSCTGAELKAAEMIKMPLRVSTNSDWKVVLHNSLNMLKNLEKSSEKELLHSKKKIKPIMLIQAQSKRKNIERLTYEVIEKCLLEEYSIDPKEIAVETSERHDLKGQDINDPNNPVKYVITVQALVEGWDCPSAYVLCSLADIQSEKVVEQLIGRIMRLPDAKRKKQELLNNAYAFVTSTNLHEILKALQIAVMNNGLTEFEAEKFVKPMIGKTDDGKQLSLELEEVFGIFEIPLPVNEFEIPSEIDTKVEFDTDKKAIKIISEINEAEEEMLISKIEKAYSLDAKESNVKLANSSDYSSEKLKNGDDCDRFSSVDPREENQVYLNDTRDVDVSRSVYEDEKKDKISVTEESVIEYIKNKIKVSNNYYREQRSPKEKGYEFRVPKLIYQQLDMFEPFNATHFSDTPFNLNLKPAELTKEEYDIETSNDSFGKVDIKQGGKVSIGRETNFIEELQSQLKLFEKDNWDITELALWLDQNISHPDITQKNFNAYIVKVLTFLVKVRGLEISMLAKDKYTLRDRLNQKIHEYRIEHLQKEYQQLLFEEEQSFSVGEEYIFNYTEYPCNWTYSGSFEFKKHYFEDIGELKSTGEEYDCAVEIDSLDEVEFWVRNLAKQEKHSFWLQCSSMRFYPDFVCKLKNGKILVIEYKNTRDWDLPENIEKRQIGALWEKQSNGKCLFIMPKGLDINAIKAKISS